MTPTETFAAYPHAMTVTTFHGQGYGLSKFAGHCAFTHLVIYQGEAIRKMAIETRDGRKREGYTAVRIERLFKFAGGFPAFSRLVFVGGAWEAHRDALVARLDTLGQVRIVKGVDDSVGYTWDGSHWRKGYARQSTKQLAATLRRTTRAVLYSTEPRGVTS